MPHSMSTMPWTIVASILFVLTGSCTLQGWQAAKTGSERTGPRWIKVQIDAPGLTTREIESEIAILLEKQLSTIPSVTHMQSLSQSGRAGVWLGVDRNSGFENSFLEIARRLQSSGGTPATNAEPLLRQVPSGPVLLVLIKPPRDESSADSFAARCAAASRMVSQLKRIPHVDFVSTWSSTKLGVSISADKQQLAEQNISPRDVIEALEKNAFQIEDGILDAATRQSPQDVLLDVDLRSRRSAKGRLQLRDVAQISLSTRMVDPQKNSKSNLPPGSILLAVHVASANHADLCSKELDEQIAEARQSLGLEITRHLDGRQLPWQEMQISMTNRLYPPDHVPGYASNPDWKSHLTFAPGGIQVRMSGIEIEQMQESAQRIGRLVRHDPSGDATLMATIGETTAPAIKIEVRNQKSLPDDMSSEKLRQTLLAQWTQDDRSRLALLKSLAEVTLVPEPGPTTMADRIEEFICQLIPGTSTPIGSVCELTFVKEPAEIWRMQQKRTIGLILSPGTAGLPLVADFDALLKPMREQIQRQSPNLQIDVTYGF